jgi:hypothetical protein
MFDFSGSFAFYVDSPCFAYVLSCGSAAAIGLPISRYPMRDKRRDTARLERPHETHSGESLHAQCVELNASLWRNG